MQSSLQSRRKTSSEYTPKPPRGAWVSPGDLFSVMVPVCHCKIGCCSNKSLQPLIEGTNYCQPQDMQQDPNGHQRPPKKYVATYCGSLWPCPLFGPAILRLEDWQHGRRDERSGTGAVKRSRYPDDWFEGFPSFALDLEIEPPSLPHEAS